MLAKFSLFKHEISFYHAPPLLLLGWPSSPLQPVLVNKTHKTEENVAKTWAKAA